MDDHALPSSRVLLAALVSWQCAACGNSDTSASSGAAATEGAGASATSTSGGGNNPQGPASSGTGGASTSSSTGSGAGGSSTGGLPGPLKQSTKNPNYFEDTTGNAVVLAGSHTWNNLQDWGSNGSIQPLDF